MLLLLFLSIHLFKGFNGEYNPYRDEYDNTDWYAYDYYDKPCFTESLIITAGRWRYRLDYPANQPENRGSSNKSQWQS